MLQLHRYFKESHSQYLPLDAPSWIFPSSFTAGACWGQRDVGAVQGVPWCWDSPERSSRELLSSEARGWHQEPAGYWKPISVGVSGAPGREMLPGRNGGTQLLTAAMGCECAKSLGKGLPFFPGCPTLLQGKPDVLERGPDAAVRDPSPSKGRGPPPTASSGGCNSRSFSILLNILKNKFWN